MYPMLNFRPRVLQPINLSSRKCSLFRKWNRWWPLTLHVRTME
jgi:hypothetical protein